MHNPYSSKKWPLPDESRTALFAQTLAKLCETLEAATPGLVVYLQGDLGAGKTSFSRAFIQTFLPGQRVKSPTYTLVETYATPVFTLYHFDLYRLCEAEELEYIGIRDLLVPPFMALIEWPSKGQGVLPKADLIMSLTRLGEGRELSLQACSELGEALLDKLGS
ncbi:MAG: tRNA (adenosine(37)-N6)-threonylcarbamoyltransferase complex ATPase subunit type 1 TsaE [Thiomicrospira sp.]|nr:tRNA (adenosine(37)-N6)-threonylcarbamoyltransferase complex ATPase subunit type 1 TsaE [Thiomicrospira sp.]